LGQKKTPFTAAENLKLMLVGGFEVAITIAVASAAVAMWRIILSSPPLALRLVNTKVSFQNDNKNRQNGGVLPLYRGGGSVIM
jgi:hypothetical protein